MLIKITIGDVAIEIDDCDQSDNGSGYSMAGHDKTMERVGKMLEKVVEQSIRLYFSKQYTNGREE